MQSWPQIHGSSYIYFSTFALSATFQLGSISLSLVHYDLPDVSFPSSSAISCGVSKPFSYAATTMQSRQNFITIPIRFVVTTSEWSGIELPLACHFFIYLP